MDHSRQAPALVVRLTAVIRMPLMIKVMPPNFWLFFQVISFFLLHVVRNPMTELFFSFGTMLPHTTSSRPRPANQQFVIFTGSSERFSP